MTPGRRGLGWKEYPSGHRVKITEVAGSHCNTDDTSPVDHDGGKVVIQARWSGSNDLGDAEIKHRAAALFRKMIADWLQ